MFFARKVIRAIFLPRLILVIGFFSPVLAAESQPATYPEIRKIRLPLLGDLIRSAAIPARRTYPVNNRINPCVNFYEYACSNVMNSFKLREDRSRHVFSFSDARERLLEFKKKYFVSLAKKTPQSPMEEEVQSYYLACMNQESRKREERALVAKVKQTLAKITTREGFTQMLAENISSSSNLSFISFAAGIPNLDRPAYHDLFFDIDLMSLPERSYYANPELVQDLKRLMAQFFIAIGDPSPKQSAAVVINFEQELASHYPTPPVIREHIFTRSKISRDKLIHNYPQLKLNKFLVRIPQHVVIRDIIGNASMEFLHKKLQTAPLEELKAIFLYFQLEPLLDDGYPVFFNQKFEFAKKYFGGPNKRADRQERCTKLVMSDFDQEVDFILLPKIFPDFPKEKFVKSIERIRASLIDQLENNSWLKSSTKKAALRKIKNAKLVLVSPNNEEEWNFNPRANYKVDAPIANSHQLRQLLINKQLQELQGPINPNRWDIAPLTVNAYYNPSYNRVVFPIGILQYPFYDPSEPDEVNLGAIGAVIAHELGHAIDNHGNNFNADGVLKPWMSQKDQAIFKKKSGYLITQFNQIGHNGEFTLSENIADLVGVTTAYQAAFPKRANCSQALQQQFFLQYARVWCGVERAGVTESRLKTDPHALERARINEQFKHQIGFKAAYSCKPTDPMVIPENEMVKVW